MVLAIIAIVAFVLILGLFRLNEQCISLAEVIPEGKIISSEEGVIEYKGVQYILGTDNLKKKKFLIESLNLLSLRDSFTVNLRFNRQIIVKTNKRGTGSQKFGSVPKDL